MNVKGDSDIPEVPAVFAENTAGGAGVRGHSESGRAIEGWSNTSYGVSGDSQKSAGVRGTSFDGRGTEGWSTNSEGVVGISKNSAGVVGQSEAANGVLATSKNGQGVTAFSDNDVGLFAQGGSFGAVFRGAVVVGKGPNPPDRPPSNINGSIVINDGGSLFLNGGGDVILGNADCAEDFDLSAAADADPGCVMVLNGNGTLRQCTIAYDNHVVGVLSGAGDYRPGLVLDRHPELKGRAPLALMGKVYCKVDASYAPIAIGDLLTTSPTPGHAMRPLRSWARSTAKWTPVTRP
ncbi:MAG: hypothetical protein M3178_09985 [Pseudomonadota bacterium]|nr:hypothetical protein [Pseudomonadota bacterium]